MELRKIIFMLLAGLLISCSTDNEKTTETSLVGSWDAIALELDESNPTQDAQLARDLLASLAGSGCYVLGITFRDDQTVQVENSFDYLDLSGVVLGNFDIPCPDQSDSQTGTYTYENGLLTFTDALGVQSTAAASILGNRLYMELEGSVYEEFINSGRLVFQKR